MLQGGAWWLAKQPPTMTSPTSKGAKVATILKAQPACAATYCGSGAGRGDQAQQTLHCAPCSVHPAPHHHTTATTSSMRRAAWLSQLPPTARPAHLLHRLIDGGGHQHPSLELGDPLVKCALDALAGRHGARGGAGRRCGWSAGAQRQQLQQLQAESSMANVLASSSCSKAPPQPAAQQPGGRRGVYSHNWRPSQLTTNCSSEGAMPYLPRRGTSAWGEVHVVRCMG